MILLDETTPRDDPQDPARCPGCGAPTVARLGWIHLDTGEPIRNPTELMDAIVGNAEAPMVCASCHLTLDVVLEPRVPFFESAGNDPASRRDRYIDHLDRADADADCGGPGICPWCDEEAQT